MPIPRIDLFKSSLVYSGPALWNSLPSELRLPVSPSVFKKRLTLHVMRRERKYIIIIIIFFFLGGGGGAGSQLLLSCPVFGRISSKHWTRKQKLNHPKIKISHFLSHLIFHRF